MFTWPLGLLYFYGGLIMKNENAILLVYPNLDNCRCGACGAYQDHDFEKSLEMTQ